MSTKLLYEGGISMYDKSGLDAELNQRGIKSLYIDLFIYLFNKSSVEAKKDVRLRTSGKLIEFEFYNRAFPLQPVDYFYNWLYINALQLNRKLSKDIMIYDSFTDIEFNPKRYINCQAKAAAMFVGLKKAGKLEAALEAPRKFLRIVYGIK